MQNFLNKVNSYPILLGLYTLLAIIASVHLYSLPPHVFEGYPDLSFTSYNNYIIFKQSFFHLIAQKDMYILYLDEHWDLYKYSPTFSLFFGLFAYLPDVIGMSLWNLLNALVFFAAIWYLPRLTNKQKGFILLASLIELLTSLQSVQSNGLMAGLLIFAFGFLEREKYKWATLMILLSAFIKIFGIVGFALFLFYPQKLKSIGWAILWTGLLFFLPVLFVGWDELLLQYQSWEHMLANDHDASIGYSVMGWIKTWFGLTPNKNILVLVGALFFLIPLAQIRKYKDFSFRLLTLASILIWVVIFNHKAESPTFIIAVSGISIWYFTAKRHWVNTVLFVATIVLTSLSVTDLIPAYLKAVLLIPFVFKAVPPIWIWLKIVFWDYWKEC